MATVSPVITWSGSKFSAGGLFSVKAAIPVPIFDNRLLHGHLTYVTFRLENGVYGTPDVTQNFDTFFTLSETLEAIEDTRYREQRVSNVQQESVHYGKKSARWSVSALLQPRGVGVLPHEHDAWTVAMGNVSTGATAVEFLFSTANTRSVNVRRFIKQGEPQRDAGAADFSDAAFGCAVKRFEVGWGNQGNNGLLQATWSGDGREYAWTGQTSLAAAAYATTTTYTPHNIRAVSGGSPIFIGEDKGNFGNRHFISTVNYTDGTFSQPGGFGLLAYQATGTDIYAYHATFPVSGLELGRPLHAKTGIFTLNGSSAHVKHLGGRITVNTGTQLIQNTRDNEYPTGVQRSGRREVEFVLDFVFKAFENEYLLGRAKQHSAQDMELIFGTEAGYKVQILMPNCQFDVANADIPDRGMTRLLLSGRCLDYQDNDALKIRYI